MVSTPMAAMTRDMASMVELALFSSSWEDASSFLLAIFAMCFADGK